MELGDELRRWVQREGISAPAHALDEAIHPQAICDREYNKYVALFAEAPPSPESTLPWLDVAGIELVVGAPAAQCIDTTGRNLMKRVRLQRRKAAGL